MSGRERFPRLAALLLLLLLLLPACRSAVRGRIQHADGLERLALGDSAGALAAFERAHWDLPVDAATLAAIADLELARGDIEGRIRARQALLKALELAPGSAEYHLRLGALLRRQRYNRTGEQMLVEALRLDPSSAEAWSLLGQSFREKYFDRLEEPAQLDSAVACFQRAVQTAPEDVESRCNLAILLLYQEKLDDARRCLEPVLEGRRARNECVGRQALLLATLEYQSKRFAAAQACIQEAFDCMTWDEREAYVGLHYVLHPDSVYAWERLTPAARESVATRYWWNLDPTPATPVNERFIEHVARVVEADAYFGVPLLDKPGWQTDRGEAYQRYGCPDRQVRADHGFTPTWRWYYGRDARVAALTFDDTYLNGDYLRVRRGAGADYAVPELYERMPQASQIGFPRPKDWSFKVSMFRGRQERTALDFVYQVQPGVDVERLLVDTAAWRGPGVRLAQGGRFVERSELFALPDGQVVGRLRFEVPADSLLLGFEVRGLLPAQDGTQQAAWVAVGRDTAQVEDLQRDGLSMSDIILAHEVQVGHGGLFDMGGVIVVPRVDAFLASDRVDLYFEIYPSREMLAAPRAVSLHYEVLAQPGPFRFWDQFSAAKREQARERPVVEATFLMVPEEAVTPQRLSIDLGGLSDGVYLLTVQVVDSQGEARAVRAVPFELGRSHDQPVAQPRR